MLRKSPIDIAAEVVLAAALEAGMESKQIPPRLYIGLMHQITAALDMDKQPPTMPACINDVKEIPVAPGHVALVSAEDYDYLSQFKWRISGGYAIRSMFMHREVLRVRGGFVDHANGNPLDNRRENLRPASWADNNRNSRRHPGHTSPYRGVSWDKSAKKWQAQIRTDDGPRKIGRFDSEIEAARAYDAMARQHHGEFAMLNFPDV